MSNKKIVITGATRGLGKSLVDRFVEMGHTVHGCGRNPKHIKELASQYPDGHHFNSVDVVDDRAVQNWARATLAIAGPPDILINNAALMNPGRPLWQISSEDFDPVIDVNIKGVANVIRHFVPSMVERKSGVIINLSSGWGRSTAPNVAPYCATKWAMEGLSKALAQELPAGMASIPLNPGIIDTDMLREAWGEDSRKYPRPEDWSRAAAELILSIGPEQNGKSLSV